MSGTDRFSNQSNIVGSEPCINQYPEEGDIRWAIVTCLTPHYLKKHIMMVILIIIIIIIMMIITIIILKKNKYIIYRNM